LSDSPDRVVRGGISHRIIESGHTDPESVKSVIGAVDGQDRGSGVGLGHSPVSLKDNDLGPDLVIDIVPFGQDLFDVILKKN
jgi:hypothetical protein